MKIIRTGFAVILSLCILSAFLYFYNYSGIHITNKSGSTDYKWNPHQYNSTMVEGFAWTRFDKNGFNNPDGINTDEIDVLLLGSSHLEGVHVSKNQNIAAQLRKRIPELCVYNIGTSGHTIYYCAKNLRSAVQEYHPNYYIVIETSVSLPENEKMIEVLNGKLKDIPSYDSGVLYYLQKTCPAIKTIYKNVQDWQNADNYGDRSNDKDSTLQKSSVDKADLAILSQFLIKMKEDCGNRQLIILYHPTISLDQQGEIALKNDGVELFAKACEDNGIIFIDMTNDFVAMYNEQHILAKGFHNTAVGHGHLNKYGCEVIAERLSKVITEEL